MALDPKALAAFAAGAAGLAAHASKAHAADERAAAQAAPHEEPDDEVAELEAQGEADLEPFAPLIELLEEYAEDVLDAVDEQDPELLLAPDEPLPDEEVAVLREGLAALDGKLRRELARALRGASLEQCAAIGDHVANESPAEDDPAKLGGWLWRVAELATPASERRTEAPPDEGDEDDEGSEAYEEGA